MSAIFVFPPTFSHDGYEFRTVGPSEARVIREWKKSSHVADWWTPEEAEIEAPGAEILMRYIVSHGGRDFAYLQCFDPAAEPQIWGDHTQDQGTFGIDQFIGDPEMIGYGHGSKFLKAFVAFLKSRNAGGRIIVDPAPDNAPAIRCYSQSGFRKEREIALPTGPALLMTLPLDA